MTEPGAGYVKNTFVMIQGPGMVFVESGLHDESFIARSFTKRDVTR